MDSIESVFICVHPGPRFLMSRPTYLRKAERHLAAADPVLAKLIDTHGRCALKAQPDLFKAMVFTVISQQLATKAARAISGRLVKQFTMRGLTPRRILKATDAQLRGCGLSSGKVKTLRAVAAAFAKKHVNPKTIHLLSDDDVAETLLPIHGIGPWSVHMILMFVLCRPDVLPVGDFGIRVAARNLYGLPEPADAETLIRIAEPWRPYRTIASWYLWRSIDPIPQ
jgi:DNA-3-methyladenine glycosylase II